MGAIFNISFDFTTDSPHYWDHFWETDGGLGVGGSDPDSASKTLQRYHQILWSRTLPCGKQMNLKRGSGPYYLTWEDFRFASDTIIVDFRYWRYRDILAQVKQRVPDYRAFVEDYVHHGYTIGGTIIFPKHPGSINQAKGTNARISDRWDLTLECIRRHYAGEESPLSKAMDSDREFFDLFLDFRDYVDYFFLQDCVTEDYSRVRYWIGDGAFNKNALPQTVDEYLLWLERQRDFLDRRNDRIKEYTLAKGT